MAVSFNIPASPKTNVYQNENFLGCDFTSDASTVDDTKSPDSTNMIRLVPGKVRKRMGYHKLVSYGEPIYGAHYFSVTDTWLIHAGNKIYNLSAPTGDKWIDADGNEIVDYDENNIILLDGVKQLKEDIIVTDQADLATGATGKHLTAGTTYDPGRYVLHEDSGWVYSTGNTATTQTLSVKEGVTAMDSPETTVTTEDTYSTQADALAAIQAQFPLDRAIYETGRTEDDGVVTNIAGKKGNVANYTASDEQVLLTWDGQNRQIPIVFGPDYWAIFVYDLDYDNNKIVSIANDGSGIRLRHSGNYTADFNCIYTNILSTELYDKMRQSQYTNHYLINATNGSPDYSVIGFNIVSWYYDNLGAFGFSTNQTYSRFYYRDYPMLARAYCTHVSDRTWYHWNDPSMWIGTASITWTDLQQTDTDVLDRTPISYTNVNPVGNANNNADVSDLIYDIVEDVSRTLIYTGMAERRSWSAELNLKLVILDGDHIYVYDGTDFIKLDASDPDANVYVPTLTISKDPSGGGTDYEALNLLQPAFTEKFYVDQDHTSTKKFQLSFGGLDSTTVKAQIMNSQGEWVDKTEGTDFSVDRTKGTITFTTAPGQSPVSGEDNVSITAYRTVEGYADRVNHCRFGILFGVNGANDRLFISGNTSKGIGQDGQPYSLANYDWYSGEYDPTYFPDTGYSKMGADNSAIMGYSIIGGYLATHKDTNEKYQPVIIREGNLVDSVPTFPVVNSLQGAGAMSPWCFSYLEEEPLFLSKLGIYAITAQDITGEKYAQNRSYYLDGRLLEEENLQDAFALTYRDYYIVCVNGHCYILDGLQPIRTDKSQPYATRQYVGFYFENIPATCMFEMGGNLCFGSNDGNVYVFYAKRDELKSYNDNGAAIDCRWETADIMETLFYKNKKYRYLALKCLPALASSVEIWAQRNGLWEMLKEDITTLRYFDFRYIDFEKWGFSTDNTAKVLSSKVRLRKLDHVRFRFVNKKVNEPFGLINFAVEYTQGGNHK
jgi:hypothetical protein